jgi:DNA polymerase-3 subunit gamma/tau
MMACIEDMASEVTDYGEALGELVSELQRIAVAQVVPDAATGDDDSIAARRALADKLSAEDVQLYYQMGIMSGRDLAFAPDPRSGFEMALLRMLAFRPAEAGGAGAAGPGGAKAPAAQDRAAMGRQRRWTGPSKVKNGRRKSKPWASSGSPGSWPSIVR